MAKNGPVFYAMDDWSEGRLHSKAASNRSVFYYGRWKLEHVQSRLLSSKRHRKYGVEFFDPLVACTCNRIGTWRAKRRVLPDDQVLCLPCDHPPVEPVAEEVLEVKTERSGGTNCQSCYHPFNENLP